MVVIERIRNVSELARRYGLKVHEMSGKSEKICKDRDADGYDLFQIYNTIDNVTIAWFWKKRKNYGG